MNDPKLTGRVAAAMLATVALGGCITVNAPEEPIVIELNVNIRQELERVRKQRKLDLVRVCCTLTGS